MKQKYALGIDAGGTFTDAVLLDYVDGKVVSRAKALTTPTSPAQAMQAALSKLDSSLLGRVGMVSLATTFATNAIVEDRGAEAGLILIGYNELPPEIPRHTCVLMVAGGHTVSGEEKTPLDLVSVERRLDTFASGLDAVAVAAFFSVRNPEHEEKVAQLIRGRCNLPVVRGHRLSMRLDALKRATTAWWNARLIPLISNLIIASQKVLVENGILAPLMVVRGDGTLMSAATALERPVETLLSGPAASILGAKHLAGLDDALIVDMGGTTTDMAMLSGGKVSLDPQGARVGRWKTHVEAVKVRTIGIGGDSLIWVNSEKKLTVGPRKVVPLSVMADQHHEIVDMLRLVLKYMETRKRPARLGNPCCFYIKSAIAGGHLKQLSVYLNHGPASEFLIIKESGNVFAGRELELFEQNGLLVRSALTPTDIRVASGRLNFGNREAAIVALDVFSQYLGMTEADLAESVEEEIRKRLCLEAIAYIGDKNDKALCKIVDRWFQPKVGGKSEDVALEVSVSLKAPVIGAGAPAAICLPDTFSRLRTRCVIPEAYDVSVAVGSVVGMVDYTLPGVIRTSDSGRFTLHTDAGKEDIDTKHEAVVRGQRILESIARERMKQDHVSNPLFDFTVKEKKVRTGHGDEILLELELRLRTTGRPDISRQIENRFSPIGKKLL